MDVLTDTVVYVCEPRTLVNVIEAKLLFTLPSFVGFLGTGNCPMHETPSTGVAFGCLHVPVHPMRLLLLLALY